MANAIEYNLPEVFFHLIETYLDNIPDDIGVMYIKACEHGLTEVANKLIELDNEITSEEVERGNDILNYVIDGIVPDDANPISVLTLIEDGRTGRAYRLLSRLYNNRGREGASKTSITKALLRGIQLGNIYHIEQVETFIDDYVNETKLLSTCVTITNDDVLLKIQELVTRLSLRVRPSMLFELKKIAESKGNYDMFDSN